MAFSITNTGKAKDILKEFRLDQQIVKGESASISATPEEIAKEILSYGEYKVFKTLDKAGKYLKESMLTRSTSHKSYDFSSLQSESSLNLQKLYVSVLNNKAQKVFNKWEHPEIEADKKVKIEFNELERKFGKSLAKIKQLISNDKAVGDFIKAKLNDEKITAKTLDELDGLLPNNIGFIEDNKIKAGEQLRQQYVKSGLKELGKAAIAGAALGVIGGGLTVLLGLAGGEPILFLAAPFVAGIGAAIGLVIPLTASAVFFIGALVAHCNKERMGTIALKKTLIKINDEFRNAVKYLNKAADLLRRSASNTQQSDKGIQPTEEQTKLVSTFLANQKNLWKPYTTAEGRNYTNKSEKDKENNTHKSGAKTVTDEKTSAIGKMKLGIAKTWAEMKIN